MSVKSCFELIEPRERMCRNVEGEETMHKTALILLGCVVVGLGLAALFMVLSGDETVAPEPPSAETMLPSQTSAGSAARSGGMSRVEPAAQEDSTITREEFDEMSEEEQNEAMEAFISAFWAMESGDANDAVVDDEYISLDLFGRPYMSTITEGEFWQLSPEDQEKAMAEIMDSCRESRRRIFEIVAQAQASIAGNDYVRAEAHLLSSLERGRELSANRDGLLITRLVGIACQKAALNEMTGMYTKLGDQRKAESSRAYLQDLDAEVEQMRQEAAAQSEG